MERKIIGLTGGIGAGKSVVARILRLKGYSVYDCDLEARRLMEESEEIKAALSGHFGEECFLPDARLNRTFLSSVVFSQEKERMWLNSLIHSAVRTHLGKWASERELCFVESAILHTSRLDEDCSEVWVVDAPADLRIRRAIERGGIDREGVEARMKAQQGELDAIAKDKIKIIDNSGMTSLLNRIEGLLKETKGEIIK